MRFYYLAALIVITLFACSGNKNMSSADADSKQKGGKWIKLFNGKTMSGWHTYGQANAKNNVWEVSDGALHVNPAIKKSNPSGLSNDLVTDEEYTNFHLKVDWKITQNGNSGIIFYVHEDPTKYKQTYETGLEMQVLDNEGHKDGKIVKHRAGDFYDLISSSSEPVKPVGQWNTAEIISKDNHLDLILNNVKIVSTTMWDDNYYKLLANSKFKNWKGFGTFKSGKIALQNHGDEVWFRNIFIKRL